MTDPEKSKKLTEIFGLDPLKQPHTATDDFEIALMQFLHPWIAIVSLDNVIEGLDQAVETLETRRDIEIEDKS